MSDDLVENWDEYVEGMVCVIGEVKHMAEQIADRIKELEAERDALEAKLEEYKMVASTIDNQWAESQDEITELKVKLAKAVENLEWCISCIEYDYQGTAEDCEIPDSVRTTLAELKGKTDD
jgi:chromosome segregation ATPase